MCRHRMIDRLHQSLRSFPSIRLTLVVGTAFFIGIVLLCFLFWPIPTEPHPEEPIEVSNRLSMVAIDRPEVFDLESVQNEIQTSIEQLHPMTIG